MCQPSLQHLERRLTARQNWKIHLNAFKIQLCPLHNLHIKVCFCTENKIVMFFDTVTAWAFAQENSSTDLLRHHTLIIISYNDIGFISAAYSHLQRCWFICCKPSAVYGFWHRSANIFRFQSIWQSVATECMASAATEALAKWNEILVYDWLQQNDSLLRSKQSDRSIHT